MSILTMEIQAEAIRDLLWTLMLTGYILNTSIWDSLSIATAIVSIALVTWLYKKV